MASAKPLTLTSCLYRALASIPSYSSVTIAQPLRPGNPFLTLQTVLSQRDMVRNAKRRFARQTVLSIGDGKVTVVSSSTVTELVDVVVQKQSPSGRLKAVLRNVEGSGSTKKRFVEIYNSGALTQTIEVTDKHGNFYSDDTFSSLIWSKGENLIVYIAEAKAPEDPQEKFNFAPDWGERFSKHTSPRIIVVDLPAAAEALLAGKKITDKENTSVTVLGPFEGLAVGQVRFGPRDESLILTGYSSQPRQHGIVACTNRPAGIYQIKHDHWIPSQQAEGEKSKLVHISADVQNARSPRLSRDETKLLYVSNTVGGPHNSCATLRLYDFASEKNPHLLAVNVVQEPEATSFPGLYLDQLPINTWIRDEWAVANSIWGSRKTILAIQVQTDNLRNGQPAKVIDLTPADAGSRSWTVLHVTDDYIVATRASPAEPGDLMLGFVKHGEHELKVEWEFVETPEISEEAAKLLSSITYTIHDAIRPSSPHLESVTLFPKDSISTHVGQQLNTSLPPLINYPHGGPHSSYTTGFSIYNAALVALGFAVAQVNYSGGLGFGQKNVDALVGNIGELEVEDTHAVAKYLVAKGLVDANRVALFGGSHGGFVSAFLIGRYPDYYKACVMRNPVINVGDGFHHRHSGLDFRRSWPPLFFRLATSGQT
ncbi:hypothetical protein BC936DRAFT_149224 [Jimgerdemannia flammicorona]|uniref:acylaminoacyl-peptidase n=1 Tax=Jimgerdemannia flammicorona TaxID=994334 RepID=A0A433D197_9FUNG|nr:hypothetical protein BC936DRAFT_149224 [Jimgerdemannia flammicorona]